MCKYDNLKEPEKMSKTVYADLPKDEKIEFKSEWAFMGLLNLDSYKYTNPDWTPEMIHEKLVSLTGEERALFWGCGECTWNIIINPSNFNSFLNASVKNAKGYIRHSGGGLCLTEFDSLTFSEQYPDEHPLPQENDIVFNVGQGVYEINLCQMFEYDGNVQHPLDSGTEFDEDGIHYVIQIQKVEKIISPPFKGLVFPSYLD